MAISKQERSKEHQEIKDSESEGSDTDYESGTDPSYTILEETHAKFSNLSIKKKSKSKSKSGIIKEVDMGIEKDTEEMEMNEAEFDEKSFERAQKIIEGGQIEKLKVDQCKVYLRKHGLRLSGNKDTLIQRIKEHQEILNDGGEHKYPVSSFVLNCKGDACTGDVVMFEQNVYEMYNIASRSASGPPCGTRIVAGRIVKESYGAAKQQHTFTIEVLWSRGEKSLPALHPLLIKGRNLYRLKTLRQRWEDEGERRKVLMEKHSRGSLARSYRDTRIKEKEKRKMPRANSVLKASTSKVEIRPQQLGSSVNIKKVEPQPQQSTSLSVAAENLATQTQKLGSLVDSGKPAIQPRQSGSLVGIGKLASEFQQLSSSIYSVKPPIQSAMRPQQSGLLVDSAKSASGFQQLGTSINYVKPVILHQQSGEFFDYGIPEFQEPQHNKNQIQNNVYNQIPYNSVNGIHGVWNQRGDRFYENYRQPDFCVDRDKRTYHRHPLTSMNHHCPMSPPHRQSNMQRQLCRYHAQGKCHFGFNCKFLHELTEECGQRRGESLHGHGQRKFQR